jgi:hypothetical protein
MHDTLEDRHYLQCSFLTRVPAGTLRAKVDLQIQIVPADGTNAAFNWREYGKPRWRLSNENLHRFAGGRKGRRLLVAPWRKPRPATVTSTGVAPNFYPVAIGVWRSIMPCWAVVAAVRGAEPSAERSVADRLAAA